MTRAVTSCGDVTLSEPPPPRIVTRAVTSSGDVTVSEPPPPRIVMRAVTSCGDVTGSEPRPRVKTRIVALSQHMKTLNFAAVSRQ